MAKRYTEDQGMDAEMEAYNAGLEDAAKMVTKDDHDCTESEAYGELYRSVLALKIGSNLPADDVEAMAEAHRRWVPIGEPNCNSFREAFNAGFKAALTTGRDRTRPQSCCHVVGAGNVCLRPQDHEGPHVGWEWSAT